MKNNKRFIRLLFGEETRFLITALFYLLITLLALIFYISVKSFHQEINKVGDNLDSLSLSVQQVIEQRVNNADMALNQVALYLSTIDYLNSKQDPYKMSIYLESLRRNFSGIEVMAIINQKGIVEINSHWSTEDNFKNRKIIDINDRPYFVTHKLNPQSGLVISDPQISKTLGTKIITVSKRIVTPDGSFKGIISSTINLENIVNSFKEIAHDSDMSITLLNQKRLVVSRYPMNDQIFGKYISMSPEEKVEVDKNPKDGRFIVVSEVDNLKRFVVYKKIERFSLTVYLGRTMSTVLYDWKNYVIFLWIITVILIITTCYLLYRFYMENSKLKDQQIEIINSARMSSVGLMAASIAHEINNPLTIVLGRAHKAIKILNDSSHPLEREELKMYFAKILDASSRMTKIISGVKVISRDANNDRFEFVKLSTLIEHVTDYLSERYKVHGVDIVIDEIPEALIKCRESQITQVLVNLLNNSYDAIEQCKDKWIKISFKITDKNIQIFVMDSGLGISPEIREKIMNPFFTSKTTSKGTGLGLYISKRILKEHFGDLRYDDSFRHTTFVLEFPIIRAEQSDN